jgi:hypothetical protein
MIQSTEIFDGKQSIPSSSTPNNPKREEEKP